MLAKFEAKAMSEERAYFDALGIQSRAEERKRVLESDVQRAKIKEDALKKAADVHGDTHKRIDGLYERLFKGPTPGFGDEDERELVFYRALEGNEGVKEGIRRVRMVKSGLGVVGTYLSRVKNNFKYGLLAAEDSYFFLDQAIYWVERGDNALGLAVDKLRTMEENVLRLPFQQAKLQRLIIILESARVPDAETLIKEEMIHMLEKAQERLVEAEEIVNEILSQAKEVEKEGLTKIRETARQLEDSRQELQHIRQGIFERVAGFGEAAPAYNECCDRADAFCEVVNVGNEPVYPEDEPEPPTAPSGRGNPPVYDKVTTGPVSRFGLADVLREDVHTH